jgi:hypothetical protein
MNLLSWAAREFNPFSLGALMQIVIASWLLSYDFRIILETDKGEDQLPSLKVYPGIWGGIWRGIVRPALLMCMWILVFFLLPWIIWTIIIKTTGIDVFWREAISPILQGVALFLAPMTLLIMAMKGFSIQLFRWDRQFRSIFRAPRMQYWVILGFGWVSGFDSAYFKDGVEVLLNFVTPANPSDPRYLYFGLLIGLNAVNALVLAYLYLVSTRMTGLFYRYNKQHLLWRGE